jgi:hypothetical protein
MGQRFYVLKMGSGFSAKRKLSVCKTESGNCSNSSEEGKENMCKTQISDADSSGSSDEDFQEDQPEPDFEQKRAMKLKGFIEENLEPGNPMTSNEAIQYLLSAERTSKAYGYQRHVDQCMANLDIYPEGNDFNRGKH